jgi:hypothetical protein
VSPLHKEVEQALVIRSILRQQLVSEGGETAAAQSLQTKEHHSSIEGEMRGSTTAAPRRAT